MILKLLTVPVQPIKLRTMLAGLLALSGCVSADVEKTQRSELCPPEEINQKPTITNLLGKEVPAQVIDGFLQDRMTAMNVPALSVAIINNNEVVYHRALGVSNTATGEPITRCSIFQGASITKPLFGYFVMTFVEEGRLDLDRPLHEYLPYPDIANDERYKKITARMALTHQTGFPNWRSDFENGELFIQFEPGSGFSYSGEGYQYLALALQEIAGVDAAGLEALFQQRVARPLGMTHTRVIPGESLLELTVEPHIEGKPAKITSTNSYEDFGAAYGVHSEALDFSKWLIGLMKGQGLSEQSFDEYFSGQGVPVPETSDNPLVLSQDFALGFVVYDTPLGRLYAHDGNNPGFSSTIALERDKAWGMVLFTNANQTSGLGVELALFLNQ